MIGPQEIQALRESFMLIAAHDSMERGEAALILELLDALEDARRQGDVLGAVAQGLVRSLPAVDGMADAALVMVPVGRVRALQAGLAVTRSWKHP